MKKLNLIIVCLIMFNCLNVDAQYKVHKKNSDYRHYTYQPGDPYNPSTAAFASLVVPGLGQMICGEGLRGTGFLLGCASSLAVSFAGLLYIGSASEPDPNFWQVQTTGMRMIVGGLVSAPVLWIWSIADASRVAKVNNLVLRDRKKVSGNLSIHPYLNFQSYSTNNRTLLGLSVKINF